MSVTGVVDTVTEDWRGDALASDAASGDTVLQVVDAGDFSEDAGTVPRYLMVGGESTPRQYVDVDVDADTVTLVATVGGSGLETGLPLVLWDPTVGEGGSQAVEFVATVRLDDDAGSVEAVVPHDLIPTSGVYGLTGATVSIDQDEDDDSDWYVSGVLGRQPKLSGDFVVGGDNTPWIPDGLPPSSAPVVTATGGIGSLAVRWTPIVNTDPVTYRLHVRDDADPVLTMTDTGWTSDYEVAAGVGITAALVRALKSGDKVIADGSVNYHVAVTVEDADGPGPVLSNVEITVPDQVDTPDIRVGALTTDLLTANDAFIGALQAVDVRAVTFTGATFQSDLAEATGVKWGYDEDGNVYIRAWAPGNPTPFFDVTPSTGMVIVAGDGTFQHITMNGGDLYGQIELKSGASFKYVGGAVAPTTPPNIGSSLDSSTWPSTWGGARGLAFDGTHFYTTRAGILEKRLPDGTLVASDARFATGWGMGGEWSVAVGGGKVYAGSHYETPLGAEGFVIERWDAATLAYEHEIDWSSWASTGRNPAIGWDATPGAAGPLIIAQQLASGVVRIRRYTYTVVSGSPVLTLVGSALDTDVLTNMNLASVLYAQDVSGDGGFDFPAGGPGRYFLTGYTSPTAYCVSAAGAARPTDHFGLGITDKVGIEFDGVAFMSLDRSGVYRNYTKVNQSVTQAAGASDVWVSDAYYRDSSSTPGAPWETPQSPKARYVNFPKRTRLTYQGHPLDPAPDPTDPNELRPYVGFGATEPTDANMHRQSLGPGVETAIFDLLPTGGGNPDAGTTFPTATPSRQFADKNDPAGHPMWEFLSDGGGQAGPHTWNTSGRARHCALLRSTTTGQTVAGANAWVTLALTGTPDHLADITVASSVATILEAGIYEVSARNRWASTNTAGGRSLGIETWTGSDPGVGSGTFLGFDELNPGTGASVALATFAYGKTFLAAGAKVRAIIRQSSGANRDTDNNPVLATLNIQRCG